MPAFDNMFFFPVPRSPSIKTVRGFFAFFMWFEDSCHVEDLVFHFSSGFIFSYNSEPGENLIQLETEFFTPRNWPESAFVDFV